MEGERSNDEFLDDVSEAMTTSTALPWTALIAAWNFTTSSLRTTTVARSTSTAIPTTNTLVSIITTSPPNTTMLPSLNTTTLASITTTTAPHPTSTTLASIVSTTFPSENETSSNLSIFTSTLDSLLPFGNESSNPFNETEIVLNTSLMDGVLSNDSTMMSTTAAVFTLIPLILITLFIILGNLLVIIAVFTKRSLRTPQNFYIVSLALTDMGVAVFVLPYNITALLFRKWIFGQTFCKLYLTVDVSLCCVSIFHLCAIGIDRYRAITDGINYVQKRNLQSVLTNILGIWVIALWIGSPPLLASQESEFLFDGHACEMPDSPGYNIHLAIGGLFFPLVIMSIIYGKIYYAIKERLQERARVACMELTSDADTTDRLDESRGDTTDTESGIGNGRRKPSAQIRSFLVNKQKFSLSKERKAAKTLGIIMAAFIFCWLPLGFLNVIGSLCPADYKPSEALFHIFTWLGYVNSGINPIIYAISNQEYQKAFRKILHID